jgi:hypothetical protein
MKRTAIFLWAWLSVGGIMELYTIFDGVPNNTFSHVVVSESEKAPWLPLGFLFFVVMCAGHWWLPKWPWKGPVWEKDEDGKRK